MTEINITCKNTTGQENGDRFPLTTYQITTLKVFKLQAGLRYQGEKQGKALVFTLMAVPPFSHSCPQQLQYWAMSCSQNLLVSNSITSKNSQPRKPQAYTILR